MDTITRNLQRQAACGDTDAALGLYWRMQKLGQEEETSSPEARLETKFGPVRLIVHGHAIRVMIAQEEQMVTEGGARRVRHVIPVTVNRVEYNASGSYFLTDDLGWSPFYPDKVKAATERDTWSRPICDGVTVDAAADKAACLKRFSDPARRCDSSFDLSRLEWTSYNQRDASASAYKKFMAEIDHLIRAWIEANPETMREARRREAVRDMERARRDVDKAQEALDAANAVISEAMGRYIANEASDE